MIIKVWNNKDAGARFYELEEAYKIVINFTPELDYFKFKTSLRDMKIITISFGRNKVYLQKAIEDNGENL